MISHKVRSLLTEYGDLTLPIKVNEIASSLGLKVIKHPFEDNISGVLKIEDGNDIIYYNENDAEVRQRFTIAHELGHYILHRNRASLFLDDHKGVTMMYRSQRSITNAEDKLLEQEANAFAACLLMPEHLLQNELKHKEFDLGSDESLEQLSKIFNVSTTAMSIRMANLGILKHI